MFCSSICKFIHGHCFKEDVCFSKYVQKNTNFSLHTIIYTHIKLAKSIQRNNPPCFKCCMQETYRCFQTVGNEIRLVALCVLLLFSWEHLHWGNSKLHRHRLLFFASCLFELRVGGFESGHVVPSQSARVVFFMHMQLCKSRSRAVPDVSSRLRAQ